MIKIDPKTEAEVLLNGLYPFAEKMLREYGQFNPFGGYIDATGSMIHAGLDEIRAKESGREKLDRLVVGLRQVIVDEGVRACGFVVNVALPSNSAPNKEDAIRFFLEHKDGYCADVFYCYVLGENNIVSVTRNYAQQGMPVFFHQT